MTPLCSRLIASLVALSCAACGAQDPPKAPPCERECQDAVALRALREMAKLVYNLKLQGQPVGPQDATTPCPLGGQARVFGEAYSNALQGSTEVELSYVFETCRYLSRDDEPGENYDMTLDGTLSQVGTLAVQPTASTALVMASESMSFEGSVYDPPLPFSEVECPVSLGQSGNSLAGFICNREAGLEL